MQKILTDIQVAAFDHDLFVDTQVKDFIEMVKLNDIKGTATVLDIGGGCGYFSKALENRISIKSRLIDLNDNSVCIAKSHGVDAYNSDALSYKPMGDEDVVCFNLILHHIISDSDAMTKNLQENALNVWRPTHAKIFINEYIYESMIGNLSGRIIYEITSSKILSNIAKLISKFVPSLRANTFGVGVRFRSASEWISIFHKNGWEVVSHKHGRKEIVSLPLRALLLVREIRRDSFLLVRAH